MDQDQQLRALAAMWKERGVPAGSSDQCATELLAVLDVQQQSDAVPVLYANPRHIQGYKHGLFSRITCGDKSDGRTVPVSTLSGTPPGGPEATRALLFAANVVELFDDATTQDDYMIDSNECAGILRALPDYLAAAPSSS